MSDQEILDVSDEGEVVADGKPQKRGRKAKGSDEPVQVQPQLKMRGTAQKRHDLYKAELANFKKNTSWKLGHVMIQEVEHCHHYHSINSAGMPQKYTGACGGHFHEVTTKLGPNGEMLAECGPPLRYVTRKTSRGTKREIKPVEWYDDDKDQHIRDTHTHEMSYVGSEMLSEQGNKMVRAQNQNAIQMMNNG